MPPHTRSQRRRPGARPQNRPAATEQAPTLAPSIGATVPLETPAARPARANRRVLSRSNPEPVDYTADYTAARTDLRCAVMDERAKMSQIVNEIRDGIVTLDSAGLIHTWNPALEEITGFSAEEVRRFGAPTLITRGTNDVQQVQMVVLMALNFMLMVPIMS